MLTGAMHVLSFLGSPAFYFPLLAVVYWCVDPRLGARTIVVLSCGSVVNSWLKLVFHDPRPFWTDASVEGREPRGSFGMPSGHAQSAVVVWGDLAARFRRVVVWAAAPALIAGIGISRVALGVHSAGQVLAGWAVGVAVLAAALWAEPRVVPWWSARPLAEQAALSLAVALAALGGMWAAVEALEDWRWPTAWARAIAEAGGQVEPITMSGGAAAAGGLFGLLAGLSYAGARIGYDAGGELWRRLARVPVGAAGVLAVYTLGLFTGTRPVQAFVVQALLAAWAVAGAPEAFVRLGLARRTTPFLTRAGEERAWVRQ